MAMWLCRYVAKGLTEGTGAQVVGEPPACATLTDLSSELLEPQGKPGWGTTLFVIMLFVRSKSCKNPDFPKADIDTYYIFKTVSISYILK